MQTYEAANYSDYNKLVRLLKKRRDFHTYGHNNSNHQLTNQQAYSDKNNDNKYKNTNNTADTITDDTGEEKIDNSAHNVLHSKPDIVKSFKKRQLSDEDIVQLFSKEDFKTAINALRKQNFQLGKKIR